MDLPWRPNMNKAGSYLEFLPLFTINVFTQTFSNSPEGTGHYPTCNGRMLVI